jgi:hypothetical protein
MSELIFRRGIFIASFQLDGICNALRLMLQCGASPGAATVALLEKLQGEFETLIKEGRIVERIPKASATMSTPELLAIAEVLRSSALVFLTPDEAEERKRTFGFAAN